MQSLILLHGALGNATTMQPIADVLKDQFDVHMPDLPGHGTQSQGHLPFTVSSLTYFLHAYLKQHQITEPILFGYSLGGYIALHHALFYPGVIRKIITLGTKFYWNPEEAEKQKKLLDAEVIENKVPAFAQVLKERHGEANWKSVLAKTSGMMYQLGQKPLLTPEIVQGISTPVCITLGSEDQMVTQQESIEIAQALPQGEFKVLEGLPHAIEKVPGEALAELIRIKCA
jgi:pimeloyl-ACP methyl ester carboxylesterase